MQISKLLRSLGLLSMWLALVPHQALASPPTSDAKIDAVILMLLGYHDGSPEQFSKLGEGIYSFARDGLASLRVVESQPCVFQMTSTAPGQGTTTIVVHAALIDAVTYAPIGVDQDGPIYSYSLKVGGRPGLQTDANGVPGRYFERSMIESDKSLTELQANAEFLTEQACPPTHKAGENDVSTRRE